MPKKIDEKGNRYGRLLVLEEKGVPKDKKNKSITWLCLCDCGNDAIVSGEYSKEEEKILLLFAKPIVFKCPKENEDKNGTQQAHY